MEIVSDKGQLRCIIGKFEQGGNLEQTGELHWEVKTLIGKDWI